MQLLVSSSILYSYDFNCFLANLRYQAKYDMLLDSEAKKF